jgi:putative CRISPR-associated protein (TIGR02619 family)
MTSKNCAKVIVSTIGTSLLTSQIDRQQESDWFPQLTKYANKKSEQLSVEEDTQLSELSQRATNKLSAGKLEDARKASAELNGIYGIYQNDISQGKSDIHFLITTDTAQGQATANIISKYLAVKGVVNVNIFSPSGLSTATTQDFSGGIDAVIEFLEKQIEPLRKDYEVTFNLTGSFKSLQGYMNTLGMFYADKIVYIFEGANSELITIPRLPITIDQSQLIPYTTTLALLAKGDGLEATAVEGLPEGLIAEIDGHYILSNWGNLIWQKEKENLLGDKLLDFPGLVYRDKFREDFKHRDFSSADRTILQETLAQVSYLFTTHGNSTQPLIGGGLQYSPLVSKKVEHFRVNLSMRVTCLPEDGKLVLYRYGHHDIEDNPR